METTTDTSRKPRYLRGWLGYYGDPDTTLKDHLVSEEFFSNVTTIDPRLVIPVALADANEIRRALAIGEGKLEELPPAVIGNSDDCVLARALSNGWHASVGSSETTISHRADGITYTAVKLAVTTLKQLGFIGVCLEQDYDLGVDVSNRYYIVIPHTWAMAEFVSWYDKGAFPELVLDEDEEGKNQVEKFKTYIEGGATIEAIRNGYYTN